MNLLQYQRKIYSQYGEEGVLEHLIQQLGLKFIECCEFGMSGTTFSNTLYFIENFNSYGVYIDQFKENLDSLTFSNTETIVGKIEVEGDNTLDNILSSTKLTANFDILSIDVDNLDYHIWDSLKNYSPKLVVIEFNPFIPPGEEYIHDGSRFSSSFLSTVELGKSKGYKLVCMTGNLIFAKEKILENSPLEYLLTSKEQDLFLDDAMIHPDNNRSFTFKRYYRLERKSSLI